MNEYKIFKPDIVFENCLKSSWSQGIKTVGEKIPINIFLKERGVFALDIDPNIEGEIYIFALPVNKSWEASTFDDNSYLSFEIYSEDKISIDLLFQNSSGVDSQPTRIIVDDTDQWKNFRVLVVAPKDLRLIIFSGSAANTANYVIKDIVIETE